MTRSPRRLKAQVQDTVSELPIHAARLAVMGVGQALLLTDRVRKDYREAREEGIGPVIGRLRDDAEHLTGRIVNRITGRGGADVTAPSGRGPAAADGEIAVGKPRRPAASRPAPARPRPPAARRKPAEPAAKQAKQAKQAKPAKPAATKPPAAGERAAGPSGRTTAAGRPKGAAAASSRTGGAGTATPPAKPGPTAKTPPSSKAAADKAARPAQAKPASSGAKERPAPASRSGAASGTGADAAAELPVPDYDKATLASVRARLRNLSARQVTRLRDYERAHAARAEFLRMYENRLTKLREGA